MSLNQSTVLNYHRNEEAARPPSWIFLGGMVYAGLFLCADVLSIINAGSSNAVSNVLWVAICVSWAALLFVCWAALANRTELIATRRSILGIATITAVLFAADMLDGVVRRRRWSASEIFQIITFWSTALLFLGVITWIVHSDARRDGERPFWRDSVMILCSGCVLLGVLITVYEFVPWRYDPLRGLSALTGPAVLVLCGVALIGKALRVLSTLALIILLAPSLWTTWTVHLMIARVNPDYTNSLRLAIDLLLHIIQGMPLLMLCYVAWRAPSREHAG